VTFDFPVPGARYVRDYVLEEAGARLLQEIDASPWLTDLQRRVQHYGYRYDYQARRITPNMYLGELPPFASPIAARLVDDGLFTQRPDQAIVNEYLPGQGISAHVDCVPCFGPTIATLSLGSECELELQHTSTNEICRVTLAIGSVLILSGAARYDWTHMIRARLRDHGRPRSRRVSVTFRTVIQHS
jgi:alkylated DNA repair dioxygenase AlkB